MVCVAIGGTIVVVVVVHEAGLVPLLPRNRNVTRTSPRQS